MTEKRANFVRLAEARVNRAARELKLIGNLSNRASYQYDEADIRKIFKALQKELDQAKARFSELDSKNAGEFRL